MSTDRTFEKAKARIEQLLNDEAMNASLAAVPSSGLGIVSAEQKFLFQSDPNRFWEIVLSDDANARFAAVETIDDLLLAEILHYGIFSKEEMIEPLASLYSGPVMQIPEERRFAVYRHVAGFVENTSIVSTNAFLPFIAKDDSRRIVSNAVVDYILFGPLDNGDPMSRVKDIIGMIESSMLENEGAAFGALLHIGHKQVCDLLIPLRDSLDQDAMNNAINCGTGFMHSATADFYLDWLEGMDGTDGAFGTVASGLALLRRKNLTDQVFTGDRLFPVRNVSPEQWKASEKPVPLAQYVQRISPRMYALERTEPPPRAMPLVLADWGLEPLTDPAETVALDDRAATTSIGPGAELVPDGRIVDVKNEWWDGDGDIYLTWGILNPNGPTLCVLGSRQFDGKHRTFFRWLHMFGGCTTYAAEAVSEMTYHGLYEDAATIHEHLVQNHERGLFHTIPSFLIATAGDETLAAIAKRLLASGAVAEDDCGRSIAYARQFGSDFFGSAGAEIRETYESMLAEARAKGEEPSEFLKMIELRYRHIADFKNARIPSWTETPMTAALIEEWWRIVSPEEFQVAALVALETMWEGASNVLSEDARASIVPWEAVIRFLQGYRLVLSR